MPSIIRGEDGMDSAVVEQGRAKAWVNFNGTGTIAIRDSFNVTSLTDNGVGDYTVNFTTAFADTNYAILVATGVAGDRSSNIKSGKTTTSFGIFTKIASTAAANDESDIYAAIFASD